MTIVRWDATTTPPRELRGGAVSVGNFDGVHRGHRALVAELRARAASLGGPAVVVTFDPHPLALLAPDRLRPLLTTPQRRAELLCDAGVDCVAIVQTTPDLLRLEPREILDSVLRERLAARAAVEGFNFRFGCERKGTIAMLAAWGDESGVPLTVVQPFARNGEVVSSSKVRAALDSGQVDVVTDLLGRAYELTGRVVPGAKRGRAIGFPTANLARLETLVPATGVYAGRARIADRSFDAVVNIGANPTFGEASHKIEAHLLGFAGDVYGEMLTLDFVARLRDTRTFTSADSLVAQLHLDIARARQLLE